jgi:hypothetical protein
MDSIHKTNLTLAAASKLSHHELSALPQTLLSSLFFSLLSSKGKHQQDKQCVFEILVSLEKETAATLSSAIRFLSSLPVRDLRKIPAIDLSQASILNWLINARVAASTPELASSFGTSVTKTSQKIGKGIVHKSLTEETKNEAKNLLSALIEDGTIAPKVVGLFRNAIKGENLIYTNDSLRSDLISYLQKAPTNANAISLIRILQNCASNRTMQERIVLGQLEGETESASDSFTGSAALAIKRMSISETIAYRKEQLQREKQRQSISQTPEQIKTMILALDIEIEADKEEFAKQACHENGPQTLISSNEDPIELDFSTLSFGKELEEDKEEQGDQNEGDYNDCE